MMILFSTKRKLDKEYREWLAQNPQVKDCPINVLTFLHIKGYLNEEAILRDHPHKIQLHPKQK